MRRNLVLPAVVVAAIWGLNFVVIDVGLNSFPPLLFAALRFSLVAVPALLLVRPPGIGWHWVLLVGLFMGVGQFGLLFVAIDQGMPAGLASLVLQCQAIFSVAISAAFLRERPSKGQLFGVLVAALGLVVISFGRQAFVPVVPLVLVVAAGACWAASNVATRAAQPRDGLSLVVWSSLIPPLPLAGLSLWFEGPDAVSDAFASVDVVGLAALLYVVVLASLVGFGIWTALLRHHPAAQVAPFSLLVPVFGLTSAWLLLDEVPNGAELTGSVVVILGLLIAHGVRRRSPRATEVPADARR